MKKAFALTIFALAAWSCFESPYDQATRERQKSIDEEKAYVLRARKENEALRGVCDKDREIYIKYPRAPFLKSCLEYRKALAAGIVDKKSQTECSDEMDDEIPSCVEWKKAVADEDAKEKMFQQLNNM